MMDTITYYVCLPFGYLLKGCWTLVGNYGLAIILFTLATKFVLLPISVWIQKNSILMVKIQPEINFLKARLMGNNDALADEQAKLFKREHYHPMLSIIPLVLQLVLLLIVVDIIYNPMTYLFGYSESTCKALAEFLDISTSKSGYQIEIINAIKNGELTASMSIDGVTNLAGIIEKTQDFKLGFLGFNLSIIPKAEWKLYTLVPIIAGASSWLLCWTQNLSNVLQHEQSKWNQNGIMVLSVALSLYLGLFVPSGIALYWVAGNVFSVIQMYLLNIWINPKKYVDYEALEESRKALADAKAFGQEDKKSEKYKENKKREKQDYKRFKNIVNKKVVIYSEKSGFYKYYSAIIDELLKRSNLNIHYVTNDPDDAIFTLAKSEPRIKPYYVSLKKTAMLMMMVSCDIFIMSTPDLDKFYLKRSFIKKDIEYIYVPHDMMSVHMSFREGAFDAFDTVFCAGPHIVKELKKIEEVYKLPSKNLVEFGYPLADTLTKAGQEANANKVYSPIKEILIAPSWQEDNLLDSCVDTLIDKLYSDKYHITVRPHPEYAKRFKSQLNKLVEKYADYDESKLSFELDFSKNKSIYTADLMITDWSGVAPEFCFATERPAVFVNTKIKCLNENWKNLDILPVEIALREQLGVSVDKENLDQIDSTVASLLASPQEYSNRIKEIFAGFVFNHGKAGEVGAKYILKSLTNKKQK